MRSRKRSRSSTNTPSGSRPNSIRRWPACFAPMARCCEICFRPASSSESCATSLLTAEAVVRRVLQRWYQEVRGDRESVVAAAGRRRARLGSQYHSATAWRRRMRLAVDSRRQRAGRRAVAAVGRRAAAQGERDGGVVESLGQGSHAALLAREKGIPTITEIPGHPVANRPAARSCWSMAFTGRW